MKIFGKYTFAQLRKAFVAFVTPGVVALAAAFSTVNPGEARVTGEEWIGVVVAMFGTGWLVFATKNADAPTPVEIPVVPTT